ncbi:MAG TPA: acetyl-CoA carboxylase biotin carboxyl carrier protein subunit [Vicinamibacterales bacterium]|nr:acetyl-CoA carboxylase biotin carboxyl carrier protein subunit [Vicinamibacterales bacterium]
MTYEIAVGDRIRTVSVIRKGAVLHVTLDGQTHVVDARRVSESAMSLLVQNGTGEVPVHSIDAAFATRPTAGDFDVYLAGRSLAVQVRQAGAFGRQKKDGAGAPGSGPQRVVAPMPGKIVRVLVKAGDTVKARQGLVVVEAMKMENELRAARAGRVRELQVSEGQSVDAGTVLLVVE